MTIDLGAGPSSVGSIRSSSNASHNDVVGAAADGPKWFDVYSSDEDFLQDIDWHEVFEDSVDVDQATSSQSAPQNPVAPFEAETGGSSDLGGLRVGPPWP